MGVLCCEISIKVTSYQKMMPLWRGSNNISDGSPDSSTQFKVLDGGKRGAPDMLIDTYNGQGQAAMFCRCLNLKHPTWDRLAQGRIDKCCRDSSISTPLDLSAGVAPNPEECMQSHGPDV